MSLYLWVRQGSFYLKFEMKQDYRLKLFGFPQIEDIEAFSQQIHLSKDLLYRLSKYNDKFYKIFNTPKKSGGFRKIYAPSKEMKAVQAWILRHILERISLSDYATAYIKEKNLTFNVSRHLGNRFFLCLDIDDFFPSIPYSKVFNVFRTIGFNPHISHVFTSLCTCEGKLPQGAVTSPAISNIVCIKMDNRISGYVGKKNVMYARYADDMTFSSLSENRLISIKNFVSWIIKDEGFEINKNKTRYLGPYQRREITGLVVSDKSMGIGRRTKRLLRAKIHRFETAKLVSEEKSKLGNHIDGWLSYLNSVDVKGHDQILKYCERFRNKKSSGNGLSNQ